MSDPGFTTIAIVSQGQPDPHAADDTLYVVHHDCHRYYYTAPAGLEDEFRAFVMETWEVYGDDPDTRGEGYRFEGRHAYVG